MSLRKKIGPAPLARSHEPRSLAPALRGSRLPTAAALALALAGVGCTLPVQDGVGPDPSARARATLGAMPSASASSGAIDPEPHALPGEAPMVVAPPPPPRSKPHKTAGKPMIVTPTY